MFEQVSDYETAGPNKLTFTRYYNSMADTTTFATALGNNWRSTYDRYLRIVSTSSITAERANGRALSFTLKGSAWTTDSDVDLKLTQTGSTWTLTDSDDTVETYTQDSGSSNEALLTSIQLRNGYTQQLQYNGTNQLLSVTDSYSRSLSLTYQSGLLQMLTTPDGLVLTYGYSSSGVTTGKLDQLASVTYSTAPQTSQSYLYENSALPFALTGLVDENGNRFTTWTYDTKGRALSSQHAGGADLTTVVYNDSDGSRTVTNALGLQTVYKFTTLQGVPKITEIDRLPSSTTAAATLKITYDSNGYIASQTDWNGNLTTYVNDVHGQPVNITEASGGAQARATAITYHATFHLPLTITTPGLTTTLTYDTSGETLTKTLTDTTTTTTPYSTQGTARTWTYTWANSLPASVQGPRTDVKELTKFTYDSSGALTATTNALNQVTKITQHSPGGLPQTIVDPNGVATTLSYDARLRLVTRTIAVAAGTLTTSYSYDPVGNLLTTTLPDGSSLTNSYDTGHRLTGIIDLLNDSTAFTLDAMGDQTQTQLSDATGAMQRQRSASFDALGRKVQVTGGAGQTTVWTYDGVGNALSITDPLQFMTQQAFDHLNRRTTITDPAKGVTAIAYDTHDRPLQVTDSNGGVTTYVYDGFGDVIQQISPDTGTTTYHYDLAGNLTQSVDASGQYLNRVYDALDRILTTTYPGDAAENIAYSYDQSGRGFGISRLTGVTDAAGTLSFSYDERGNVLSEVRNITAKASLNTAYAYDAASRISSITYPSGWSVNYTRDNMGRIMAASATAPGATTPQPILAAIRYLPFGPVGVLT